MITQTTCYVIECDECGTEVYDSADIEGTPHYDTEADARARIVPCGADCDASSFDFHQHGDRLLCSTCSHRADCAERGHRWGKWSAPYQGRRYRICAHCHKSDITPAPRTLRSRATGDETPAGASDKTTTAKEVA